MFSHVKQALLFMQIKWMLWRLVLWNPRIESWTLFYQQNITMHFHQKENKDYFITYENLSIWITWISSEWVCFKPMSNLFMCSFEILKKKPAWKRTPCKRPNLPSYSSIPKENSNWTLGGMIKLRGNPKTNDRAGSMISFLRKQNVGQSCWPLR